MGHNNIVENSRVAFKKILFTIYQWAIWIYSCLTIELKMIHLQTKEH